MTQLISNTEKSNTAHAIYHDIKKAEINISLNYLYIGKMLDEFKENKLWSHYGEHLKNFDDFVKELDFSRTTAYGLVRVWKRFGRKLVERGESPSYRRLLRIPKDDHEDEWIEKAGVLSDRQFNREIREYHHLPTADTCYHPLKERQYFYRCERCGEWSPKMTNKQIKKEFQEIYKEELKKENNES